MMKVVTSEMDVQEVVKIPVLADAAVDVLEVVMVHVKPDAKRIVINGWNKRMRELATINCCPGSLFNQSS